MTTGEIARSRDGLHIRDARSRVPFDTRKVIGLNAAARYMTPMETLFSYLVGIAMAAVLAVLVVGVASMFRGGEFNRKYANKLMRLRVLLQALALLLFAIFMLFFRHQS